VIDCYRICKLQRNDIPSLLIIITQFIAALQISMQRWAERMRRGSHAIDKNRLAANCRAHPARLVCTSAIVIQHDVTLIDRALQNGLRLYSVLLRAGLQILSAAEF
jgi:hypothetical protein